MREKLIDLVRKKGQETIGYRAYLVEIIPKNKERYNRPFITSDHTTGLSSKPDELVRQIDGASFYELITGYPDGLQQIFKAIPLGLKDLHVNLDDSQVELAFKHFNSTIG